MVQFKKQSLGSAKLVAAAVLGLVSVAVTVMALREFNVYPHEASGTIAPAKRIVSNQIDAGGVLVEGSASSGKDASMAGPGQNMVDGSMESSLESSTESSLTSSMSRGDGDSGSRDPIF